MRLARALLLSGAPPSAVQAARELRCDVCLERSRPKSQRAEDSLGKTQLAAILPDRSSASMVDFLLRMWWPLLGPPRQIIADQGREFVSEEFQTFCSAHSVHLWHCAVQAPWQNGVAERSGGTLKALIAALVAEHVVIGDRDMANVVGEACAAYNSDLNSEGVSPLQCVTGRQPTAHGAVLENFSGRLAEHGLIDEDPSLQQRVALRESARVAMVRLHFSRAIRKAELARSREPTIRAVPQPGDTVYFWRAQRVTKRGDPRLSTSNRRRRLELRRWHGPAIVIAIEQGSGEGTAANAFLSFKGQVTKCALEHVRPASSLEQLASGSWEAAIKDLLDGAVTPVKELAPGGLESIAEEVPETVEIPAPIATTPVNEPPGEISTAAPGTPVGHLLQRPVLQRSLQRAQGQPLAVDLSQQALARGQPADFAAELRLQMERGRKRQTSESEAPSSASALEPPASSRRTSGEDFPHRLSPESDDPASVPVAAVPPRLSLESGGHPASVPSAAVPRRLSPESGGHPAGVPEASRSAAAAGGSSLAVGSASVVVQDRPGEVLPVFEALTLDREQLERLALGSSMTHPLLQVQALVECDRQQCRFSEKSEDHGSWDGRWSLPSSSQHALLQEIGAVLPTGCPEDHHEVNATGGRKELQWSSMSSRQKEDYKKAAEKGWAAYVDNDAIKVLSVQESLAVRKELARKGELDRILTPRFVMTDKNQPLRTEGALLPEAPSARLVVPGFRDRANLAGEIRRDAPTGSRLSQHLLLCLVAWHSATWSLLSADVKAAFLKGDPFVSRELYIGPTNEKTGPGIPLPTGCLARVLKGVFGLADAPRQWWMKLSRSLEAKGWVRSVVDQAVWFLWDGAERKRLKGMIVSHVDDLLFGGDQAAEKSLMDVGAQLGFREVVRDAFTWCGKYFEKHPDGTVTLSMKEYHENPRVARRTPQRSSHPRSTVNSECSWAVFSGWWPRSGSIWPSVFPRFKESLLRLWERFFELTRLCWSSNGTATTS